MKRLIEQRYLVRHNLTAIIGFCLFCYFSYNIILGERSALRLMTLESITVEAQSDYDDLHVLRTGLESRVSRLRPGSLDRDLLEERARIMLGYSYPGEKKIVLQN
jgi:cell division protein FtsB